MIAKCSCVHTIIACIATEKNCLGKYVYSIYEETMMDYEIKVAPKISFDETGRPLMYTGDEHLFLCVDCWVEIVELDGHVTTVKHVKNLINALFSIFISCTRRGSAPRRAAQTVLYLLKFIFQIKCMHTRTHAHTHNRLDRQTDGWMERHRAAHKCKEIAIT